MVLTIMTRIKLQHEIHVQCLFFHYEPKKNKNIYFVTERVKI